jgi:hypothetical protein
VKRLLCVIPHSPAFDSCFPLLERLQARGRVRPQIILGPRLRQVDPRAEAAIRAAGVPFVRASVPRMELGAILDILRTDAVLTHTDPRAYGGKLRPRDAMLRALGKPVVFVQHGMVQMGLHYPGTRPKWQFHAGLMLLWAPLPDPQAAFFDPPVADRLVVTGFLKANRLGPSPHAGALAAAFAGWRQRLLICHNYGHESPLYPAAAQEAAFAAWAALADARPDTLIILRGHRGRGHPENAALEQALLSGRRNVILSERHAGLMRMATIHDVMAAVDRVVTHPSTVVLDAVYDGRPLAVFDAWQPDLAALPRADTAAQIAAFLDDPDPLRHAAALRAAYGALDRNLDIAAEAVENHLERL